MIEQPHYLTYGLERIPFKLQPRKSNVPRVLIKVHADCRVVVHAPLAATKQEILHAVKKRTRWIYRQRDQFKKQLEHITPRNYVSGESHYYLGKKHLLQITVVPGSIQKIKLLRGKFAIQARNRNKKNIRTVLFDWYKEKAREVFNRRLDAILPQTLWVAKRPPIRLLSMQTQWGSCSSSGALTLNPHLIKASPECIDYVILHELCHIAEHNHSDKFYRLIKQVLPNWEAIKEKLDSMASELLNL